MFTPGTLISPDWHTLNTTQIICEALVKLPFTFHIRIAIAEMFYRLNGLWLERWWCDKYEIYIHQVYELLNLQTWTFNILLFSNLNFSLPSTHPRYSDSPGKEGSVVAVAVDLLALAVVVEARLGQPLARALPDLGHVAQGLVADPALGGVLRNV